MRAILIDAVKREVREVQIGKENFLQDCYRLLDCMTITHAIDVDGEVLYVDDKGLLKEPRNFFAVEGGHQPFAGSGIIVAQDEDGYSADSKLAVERVRKLVRFTSVFTEDELRKGTEN